jgi:hypothetical protein
LVDMGINSKKTTGEVRPVLAAIPSDGEKME